MFLGNNKNMRLCRYILLLRFFNRFKYTVALKSLFKKSKRAVRMLNYALCKNRYLCIVAKICTCLFNTRMVCNSDPHCIEIQQA